MEKIACYGVRDYEMPVFNELAQKYNYDLDLFKEYLTDDNFSLAYGYEVIMIRGNCFYTRIP